MPSKELTVASETSEDGAIQVEVTLPVRPRRQESGDGGQTQQVPGRGGGRSRIPRITRLMALAIKFQDMVDRGDVCDYADLARLGYVSRARLTQIMNLLNLAPTIQETLLFVVSPAGRALITERTLRRIVAVVPWDQQLDLWARCGTAKSGLTRRAR